MKYVIKNCPAYDNMPNMYNEIYGWCKYEHDIDLNKCLCENISDCLLKQIAEKCDSKASKVLYDGEISKLKFIEGNPLAKEILELLKIEECEE